ncbi:MAG TPA: winged helix-turn-helix transcriptional regulator, partial [Trueperaceae bacterium]
MLSQRILDLIRREGSTSRAELARRLKVSKPTISGAVGVLLDLELFHEGRYATSSGGRPPRLLDFNPRAGFVIGMDIGATTARAVLADLQGEVVARARQDTT